MSHARPATTTTLAPTRRLAIRRHLLDFEADGWVEVESDDCDLCREDVDCIACDSCGDTIGPVLGGELVDWEALWLSRDGEYACSDCVPTPVDDGPAPYQPGGACDWCGHLVVGEGGRWVSVEPGVDDPATCRDGGAVRRSGHVVAGSASTGEEEW